METGTGMEKMNETERPQVQVTVKNPTGYDFSQELEPWMQNKMRTAAIILDGDAEKYYDYMKDGFWRARKLSIRSAQGTRDALAASNLVLEDVMYYGDICGTQEFVYMHGGAAELYRRCEDLVEYGNKYDHRRHHFVKYAETGDICSVKAAQGYIEQYIPLDLEACLKPLMKCMPDLYSEHDLLYVTDPERRNEKQRYYTRMCGVYAPYKQLLRDQAAEAAGTVTPYSPDGKAAEPAGMASLISWTNGKMRTAAIFVDGQTDNLLTAMKVGSYVFAGMKISSVDDAGYSEILPAAAVANIILADALRYGNSLETKLLIYFNGDTACMYRNTDRKAATDKLGLQLLARTEDIAGLIGAQDFVESRMKDLPRGQYIKLDLFSILTMLQERMPDTYNEQALEASLDGTLSEGDRWALRNKEIYRT